MKKFFTFLIVLSFSLTLSACEKAPEGDAQTIINKAWEKFTEKNATYDSGQMTLKGKANIEMEKNIAEISGTGDILFDGQDAEKKKTAIKLDLKGNGEIEGKKGSITFKGELRFLEKMLYLLIENVNIDAGDPQTNTMANLIGNLYKNQWISLPADDLETPDAGPLETLSGKENAEIARKHHFIDVKQDLGGGKYEVVINLDKLKAYLKEMGEANKSPLSNEDLAAIDQVFAAVQYRLELQINDEYDVTWVKGSLQATDDQKLQDMNLQFEANIDGDQSDVMIELELKGETPGKLKAEFDLQHDEKSVSIEKPADAQEFDPGALFGMGGNPGANDAMMESMTSEMMENLPVE